MNIGNKKVKISKTDVARYININSDQFPDIKNFKKTYDLRINNVRNPQFGFWLRNNKPEAFARIFKWANKRNDIILTELYGKMNKL